MFIIYKWAMFHSYATESESMSASSLIILMMNDGSFCLSCFHDLDSWVFWQVFIAADAGFFCLNTGQIWRRLVSFLEGQELRENHEES